MSEFCMNSLLLNTSLPSDVCRPEAHRLHFCACSLWGVLLCQTPHLPAKQALRAAATEALSWEPALFSNMFLPELQAAEHQPVLPVAARHKRPAYRQHYCLLLSVSQQGKHHRLQTWGLHAGSWLTGLRPALFNIDLFLQ